MDKGVEMTEIFYTPPKIINNSFPDKHLKNNRLFQGIPSIEVSAGGRLFAAWQIGGNFEPCNDICVLLAISCDGGKTWSKFSFEGVDAPFKGAASRFFLRRLESGNLLYVHNNHESQRTNMTAQLSLDDGITWHSLALDDRMWLSYPDGAQDKNGVIRVVYDRGRSTDKEIIMATFTEDDILNGTPAKIELVSKSKAQ